MDNSFFSAYKIEDRSYVSFIKREIHNALTQGGFNPRRTGEIDIIVSELASNLIKHANGGELLYRVAENEGNKIMEIFCIDKGPGTNDIARMMKDGSSSTNTLGHGLGAINRLSDFFQIYSMRDWGTVSYSGSNKNLPPTVFQRNKDEIKFKVLQTCMPGEKVCGDGYFIKKTDNQTQIFVGDGLGHGENAHEAVQSAIAAFKDCDHSSPAEILRFIHQRVKKTRGLVATVACLEHEKKEWKICGIGNITTRLYHGIDPKNYMAHNGIVGLNVPNTMNDYIVEKEKYQHIIMYSDGIRTRWDLMKYPSILKYDSSIIAGVIYKDHARGNDDVTILVGKINH